MLGTEYSTYWCWREARPSCRGTPPEWSAAAQTPVTDASSACSARTWWRSASDVCRSEKGQNKGLELMGMTQFPRGGDIFSMVNNCWKERMSEVKSIPIRDSESHLQGICSCTVIFDIRTKMLKKPTAYYDNVQSPVIGLKWKRNDRIFSVHLNSTMNKIHRNQGLLAILKWNHSAFITNFIHFSKLCR